MRWKPPRLRVPRRRGEILPQLTTTCQVPKTKTHSFFTIFLNSRNLHNSYTKSPQTGRNYTTRPPPCQVFFTDPLNLHIIFTNPAIELMFGPHRSSYAAPLYGHLLQNWPIRRTPPEPAYTGSLDRTSSIWPLPLELVGARTPR